MSEALNEALVTSDPEIMSGALCFAGTRVPVKNLFDYLEGGSTLDEFLEDFPTVNRERAVAVIASPRLPTLKTQRLSSGFHTSSKV